MATRVLLLVCLQLAFSACFGYYLQWEMNDVYNEQIIPNLDLTNKSSLAFSVWTHNDAYFSLQPQASGVYTFAYDVLLGGWGNTRSVIKDQVGFTSDSHFVASYNGPVVSDQCQTEIWVSWTGGIKVGTGKTVGANTILQTNASLPGYKVTNLAASLFAARGSYSFNMGGPSKTIQLTTQDYGAYHRVLNLNLTGQSSVKFTVQAQYNAYIRLEGACGVVANPAFEFAIGEASNLQLRLIKGGGIVSTVNGVFLNPRVPQPFWISWSSSTGMLKIGKGTIVGTQIILSYPTSLPYQFAGLSVFTTYSTGDWVVSYP